jgi:hypothetical protein
MVTVAVFAPLLYLSRVLARADLGNLLAENSRIEEASLKCPLRPSHGLYQGSALETLGLLREDEADSTMLVLAKRCEIYAAAQTTSSRR